MSERTKYRPSTIPEPRYGRLLELGTVGIVEWDDTGLITEASPAFLAMSGYSCEELAARQLNIFALTPPEFHPEIAEGVRVMRETGVGPTVEMQYLRKDGSRADVIVSSVAIDDARSRGKTWVIDVSGRAEIERGILLERSLMGIVSHDLRSPLTAISMSAGLMLREGGLSDRQERLVQGMAASAARASRMIHDLLEVTRSRFGGISIAPSAVDLRDVVQRVLAELAITHPERDVELTCDGDCRGQWDADRIAQLLSNLLSNAIHYSPEASRIRMSMRCDVSAAVVRVHNEGPPIPDDLRETLFEPMTYGQGQRGREPGSLGLGLYIVDQIVRAHGGTIAVDSSRDDGTTFAITLPRGAG